MYHVELIIIIDRETLRFRFSLPVVNKSSSGIMLSKINRERRREEKDIQKDVSQLDVRSFTRCSNLLPEGKDSQVEIQSGCRE